ncbi:MAG TPA: pyridoxal-phosphate dependent enzyme [Longimicrobiales bacterium]|nr:pyridoxal-phosphate dependent enzyme [Longimicrobiales bacterium]
MRIEIGTFPSPLERVRVEGVDILVKRDDICAPGYAGNKLRKLEFLLADAQARGARRVVTAGATGSHHAFATAYHASRLGLPASLVLFPQRVTPHVREMLLLMQASGAELRWVRRMEAVPLGMWRARLAHRADAPVIIPPGGSNATGTLGYVRAGLELAQQLGIDAADGSIYAGADIATGRQQLPTAVHVAAGTLGTAAGLAIALGWVGLEVPIVATRITSRIVTNERVLQRLVRDTLRLLSDSAPDVLGMSAYIPAGQLPHWKDVVSLVRLRHDQLGTGYGHTTPQADAAVASFRNAGLTLDTTYTAKAAASVLEDVRAGGRPLFWHTLSAVLPRELADGTDAARLPQPFRDYLG